MQGEDFAELYRKFVPRVLNYMRVRLSSEAVAQDLTAATFERAFSKRQQLRDPDAFAAWLFRIARNELRQYYRRYGRHGPVLPLSEALDVSDGKVLPEEEVARAEELGELLAALRRLSNREQEIIRLKFAAGLSNRSIAALMGLSDSNVAVIVYRAVRRLRQILAPGGEE